MTAGLSISKHFNMKKLPLSFYNRSTIKVAQNLLGKFLIRRIGSQKISGKIVETEAYCGPNDLASHAAKGRTNRTSVMFGPAGYIYVYLIYGMYYCLNIVTEKKDYPAAVLIRAVEIPDNPRIASGPGKLCRYFQIDKKLNNQPIIGTQLWVKDYGLKINSAQIIKTPRIGVDYAGEKYRNKPWRFYLKNSPAVSRR